VIVACVVKQLCAVTAMVISYVDDKFTILNVLVGDGNLHLNISTPELNDKYLSVIEPFVYEYVCKSTVRAHASLYVTLQPSIVAVLAPNTDSAL
jgi:hypothetical protein